LILTLSWIIVIATLLTLIVALNKFGVITGKDIDTGEANITVTSTAAVRFIDGVCNFGSGQVNEDIALANITTHNTNVDGGTWTACDGLQFTNEGNVDVEANLSSNTAAAGLIPEAAGTEAEFNWYVDNSTGCAGTSQIPNGTYVAIAADANVTACSNITFSGTPTLDIEFELKIPQDATPSGESSATITLTGTAIA
jgi:hypothetical protein